MTTPAPGPGKLGLTTFRQVLISALAGALIAAFILSLFDLFQAFPPVVPWTVPAVLVLMAAGAWLYARGLKRRVDDHSAPAVEAVRALIIAKSTVMTGAVLAGGHAVYAARWLGQLSAPLPASRVLHGLATIVAALVFTAAGHVLERACVAPDDDDPEHEPSEAG